MADQAHTILVVDDDPDILDTLRVILEAEDFHVVTAASAEEGIRLFRDHAPHLVIADLMMEEVDSGTGFVRDLRLLGNEAPVFMLSSVGNALHATLDYASLGLRGVFQKPVDPRTLVATVRANLP